MKKISNLFNNELEIINQLPSYPYIIAEIGVNHEGNLDIAKQMVNDAKESGADAVKFQTYKANTIASKNSPAYWDTSKEPTESQYKLFKKHEGFWQDEMIILKNYCDNLGIEFMSTPFDFESAEFLNDLMDVFKISSSDITNKPFIQYISNFNKPIILSTGASSIKEINDAVNWIEKYNNKISILHCILNYPTAQENANLGMIKDLIEKFPGKIIGYSDHTLPGDMENLIIATLLGAKIIEKHFTYDKSLMGNDHYHAMDKSDLKRFNEKLKEVFSLLGSYKKTFLPSEQISRRNARRSIVASKRIQSGETISDLNITFKRPATGISPKDINNVLGLKANGDIDEDQVITWELLK